MNVNTPADDCAVNAPATDIRAAPFAGPSDWPPVDNSRATTAPVPAARHHAPARQERFAPAPTAQFDRASAAPPHPGVYSPPAAYSQTPFPAHPGHTPVHPTPGYAQAHPGRPYPPESDRGHRPPQPYPADRRGRVQPDPQSPYRQGAADPGAIRITTTQRPHRRVDTSVLCAAAALIVLALAVLIGLML